jgi:outer membrane protein assembly factor BamB
MATQPDVASQHSSISIVSENPQPSSRVGLTTRRGFLRQASAVTLAVSVLPALTKGVRRAAAGTAGAVTTSPWPMYGHDSGHSGRSPANGPLSPALLWSYPLSTSVRDNASPIVAPDGSTIYLPGASRFFAIDAHNGSLRWTRWGTSAFDQAGTRLAPAVAADGTVYTVAPAPIEDPRWPSQLLYALSPTGEIRWSYTIGRTTYGSPTLAPDGTILLGSTTSPSVLHAIRPTGARKWVWQSNSSGWIESSPALAPNGTAIYLQHNTLGLVALTAAGGLKWQRAMGSGGGSLGQAFNSPSVSPSGVIYIGSSDHYFYAVNPNGSERWKVAVDAFMYQGACAISADGSTIFRGDNRVHHDLGYTVPCTKGGTGHVMVSRSPCPY